MNLTVISAAAIEMQSSSAVQSGEVVFRTHRIAETDCARIIMFDFEAPRAVSRVTSTAITTSKSVSEIHTSLADGCRIRARTDEPFHYHHHVTTSTA